MEYFLPKVSVYLSDFEHAKNYLRRTSIACHRLQPKLEGNTLYYISWTSKNWTPPLNQDDILPKPFNILLFQKRFIVLPEWSERCLYNYRVIFIQFNTHTHAQYISDYTDKGSLLIVSMPWKLTHTQTPHWIELYNQFDRSMSLTPKQTTLLFCEFI